MKQFLYLDNDIVNSIIAQKDNGLIKDFKTENASITGKQDQNVIDTDIEGKAGAGLLKLVNAEVKLSVGAKIEKEKNFSNTTREIFEKTMHDASFDVAYEYIQAKNVEIGNSQFDDYGEYIELKRVFDFVDLEYIEKMFLEKGLIDYLKKNTRQTIQNSVNELTKSLNREQRREIESKMHSEMQKEIDNRNKEYDEMCEIITMFKKMIPYNRMLISNDGYLIPLDEKFFRVNPSSVGFMYGGEITCVGMITNIIGKDCNPNDEKNVFAILQFSVNEVLRSILPTKEENICVIHPIAVYYNK